MPRDGRGTEIDDTVRAVVEASFILWLRPHTDPQASTYCDRYDRDRALPLQGGYSAHPCTRT